MSVNTPYPWGCPYISCWLLHVTTIFGWPQSSHLLNRTRCFVSSSLYIPTAASANERTGNKHIKPKLLNSHPEWGHKDGPTLLRVWYDSKLVEIHLDKGCNRVNTLPWRDLYFDKNWLLSFQLMPHIIPTLVEIHLNPMWELHPSTIKEEVERHLQYAILLYSRNSRCDVPLVCASEIAGITTWVPCPTKKYLMKPPKGGHNSKHMLCWIQLNKKIGNNNHRRSMTG